MGILEPQKPGVIAPPWKPPCNSGKSNDSLDIFYNENLLFLSQHKVI